MLGNPDCTEYNGFQISWVITISMFYFSRQKVRWIDWVKTFNIFSGTKNLIRYPCSKMYFAAWPTSIWGENQQRAYLGLLHEAWVLQPEWGGENQLLPRNPSSQQQKRLIYGESFFCVGNRMQILFRITWECEKNMAVKSGISSRRPFFCQMTQTSWGSRWSRTRNFGTMDFGSSNLQTSPAEKEYQWSMTLRMFQWQRNRSAFKDTWWTLCWSMVSNLTSEYMSWSQALTHWESICMKKV